MELSAKFLPLFKLQERTFFERGAFYASRNRPQVFVSPNSLKHILLPILGSLLPWNLKATKKTYLFFCFVSLYYSVLIFYMSIFLQKKMTICHLILPKSVILFFISRCLYFVNRLKILNRT